MADQVVVATSVYNLAGDEADRPYFLKSLVMGGVIQNAPSLGRVIATGYKNGPGIRFRQFLNWAKKDPEFQDKIGVTSGNLQGKQNLNQQVIKDEINKLVGPDEFCETIELARIDDSDISYWVLKRLASDFPDDTRKYRYEYDKSSNQITIFFEDGQTDTFDLVDPVYTPDREYLYVRWIPARAGLDEPANLTTPWQQAPAPNLAGFIHHSGTSSPVTHQVGYREVRTVSYTDSNGNPVSGIFPDEGQTISSTTRSVTHNNHRDLYYKDTFKGRGPGDANSIYSERYWLEVDTTYQVGDWANLGQQVGVGLSQVTHNGQTYNRTVRVVKQQQSLDPVYYVHDGTTNVVHRAWDKPRYFIYEKGTGNAQLDALFNSITYQTMGMFFPPIPFRYENKAVGPAETNAKEWWVNIEGKTPYWVPPYHEMLVMGGPITEAKSILCEQVGFDPSNPNRIKIRARNDQPIGLALSSRAPRFRIITYPPYTNQYMVDGDINGPAEQSDWMEFSAAPEAELPADPTEAALITRMSEIYPVCKRAFKKAFGQNYDKVQEKILANDKIENIDHIYAVFGVSLNVKENACKKYVYKFLQELLKNTSTQNEAAFNNWVNDYNAAYASEVAWNQWADGSTGDMSNEPQRLPYPSIPWQSLKVESVRSNTSDYRMEIRWAFMFEDGPFPGLATKPDGTTAKRGEVWLEVLPPPIAQYKVLDKDNPDGFNQAISITWQESLDSWRKLTVIGLQHINHIYKDMKVMTTAKAALEPKPVIDPETGDPLLDDNGNPVTVERESEFIVPLNETVYRSMSLVDSTQMATACAFLVFNCYEIDKEEWYETWWFKVILIVAVIGVSVAAALFTGGSSLGIGGGVIVGLLTGAGMSMTAALVLAAIINVIAGLLIAWIINKASVAIFGEKWGPIIAGILTFALTMGMSAGSFAELTTMLSTPQFWISVGMATTNGVASYMQQSAQETLEESARQMAITNAQAAEIQRQREEVFGKNRIDPSIVSKYISELTERPEHFLQRTLMTGSDIVEVTLGYIENFVQDRLRLALP